VKAWLTRRWYSSEPAPWYLRALSAIFGLVASLRRRRLQATAPRLPVPVIVVGNIAVGGTGKTPFTIWLVERLREWGWKPGVISRGYGGRSLGIARTVVPSAEPDEVGDEPVLIAQRARCPIVVGADRVAAARELLAKHDVDVIVSDDGLQHYALWRDLEIVVVDASRGLGNGALLPAGPLREPPSRLGDVDLVVVNGKGWTHAGARQVTMRLAARQLRRLTDDEARPIASFAGQDVHAVAGIGNPARFFSMLSQHNLQLTVRPFPDHHPFTRDDLDFGDALPVLMTEKDAVKCRKFASDRLWVVPVDAEFDADAVGVVQELAAKLRK